MRCHHAGSSWTTGATGALFTLVIPVALVMGGCTSSAANPSELTGEGGCPSCQVQEGGVPISTPTGPKTPIDAAKTTTDEIWEDGKQITSSVMIDPGITVQIANGATITCAPGITIVVEGTLTASSATGKHAILTGTAWSGLQVSAGGKLSLDGVDITGASTPLYVQASNASASYSEGTITGATTAFSVDAGGKLTTSHATVEPVMGSSSIGGSFTASYLDYASAHYPGFELGASSSATITDSTLHGTGPVTSGASNDMLVSTGASSLTVQYTMITGAHCGFHFNAIDSFNIDHVTDESDAWGAMLYGSSGAGTRTISYSNFESNEDYDLDEQGINSSISVDHCYTSDKNRYIDTQIVVTNPQSSPVSGAMPR